MELELKTFNSADAVIERAERRGLTGNLSERKRFRGPGLVVSKADWMPGTVWMPVSLRHAVDKAESYRVVYKEGGSGRSQKRPKRNQTSNTTKQL